MNNLPWYASWFDTPFYHILYKNRNDMEAERFMTNLVNELGVPSQAKILDLACGKGRHSVYLNSLGFQVIGTDLSAQSITHAKQFENKNLHFEVQDLREPYKEEYFDYIFNLFTSFGYFENEEDNVKALKSMAYNLKSNGTIVIDFMNSFKSAFNLRERETKTIDGITFTIKRKLDNKFFVKNIEFLHEKQAYKYEERVQGLTQKDFEKYCKEANLKIVEVYGNYDLDYFSKNTSDRLILRIEKK